MITADVLKMEQSVPYKIKNVGFVRIMVDVARPEPVVKSGWFGSVEEKMKMVV